MVRQSFFSHILISGMKVGQKDNAALMVGNRLRSSSSDIGQVPFPICTFSGLKL